MFAYCRNNPASRTDASGTLDYDCDDENNNLLGNDPSDWSGGTGGGFWSGFSQSMRYAAQGLSMAAGQKRFNGSEMHHVFSNKNKTYKNQFEEIMDRYGMSLDSQDNIVELSEHCGRHTNSYHEYMLDRLRDLDKIANGDPQLFREGFMLIIEFLIQNPWLPYAR